MSYSDHVLAMDDALDEHLGDDCTLHYRGLRYPLRVPLSTEDVEVRDGEMVVTSRRVFISVQPRLVPATIRENEAQVSRRDPFSGSDALEWWDVIEQGAESHTGRLRLLLKSAERRPFAPTRTERLKSHADTDATPKRRLRSGR